MAHPTFEAPGWRWLKAKVWGLEHAFERAKAAPSFDLLFNGARAPSDAETKANPRSRSAKLRVGVRTSAPVWMEAA